MENGKYIILKSILILATFVLPVFCYGYANETTHPALTNEAIDVFNYYYPSLKLDDTDRESVLRGSIEEDQPETRCLNHFYDPIYSRGLTELVALGLNAKRWSQDTTVQAGFGNLAGIGVVKDLFSAESDYSWNRAVYDYVYGDKQRALESLGHTLHLLEDMSVPPHVRNDQHMTTASPYEVFTAKFDKKSVAGLSDKLIKENNRPIAESSLDVYFDKLATFTNENFFSEDTILDEKYAEPEIDFREYVSDKGVNNLFGFVEIDGKKIKLIKIERDFDIATGNFTETYFLEDKKQFVLSDYWSILSEKAVSDSSGVIKLFFDDVAKEKQTMALYNKNQSYLAKIKGKIAGWFGVKNQATVASGLGENGGGASELGAVNKPAEVATSEPTVSENEDGPVAFYDEFDITPTSVPVSIPTVVPVSASTIVPKVNDLVLIPIANNQVSGMMPYAGFGGGGGNPVVVSQTVTTEENTPENQTKNTAENETEESQESATESEQTNQTTEDTAINPPTITNPANFSQFNTTEISFSGLATFLNIISTDFSSATTTVAENGEWFLTLNNFNQGTTTVNFFASNPEQTKTSEPTPIEIFVDSQTPDIVLNIQECENSLSENGCIFNQNQNLHISWSSSSDDLAYFTINQNGVISQTTATSTEIALTESQALNFSVSATDNAGNTSEEISQTVEINTLPVVISEVSWAGTNAQSSDEWIELYNNTDKDISLDSWTLYTEDEEPYIPLSGVIKAKNYYLLERTSDETISDISANLIYTGGLSNDGEHLILAFYKNNATTTVDEIAKVGNWNRKGYSYSNGNRGSMERINLNQPSGTNLEDWATAVSLASNGIDSGKNKITGTPKKRNSVSYSISGQITENKTLTLDNSPYLITDNSLTVNQNVTLTIEPSVVIKFVPNGSLSLVVNGTLLANGTEDQPIVFTSLYDDEFGGDTNSDGICEPDNASSTAVCPQVGDWRQILFENTSKDSQLSHTIIRYGGRYTDGQPQKSKGMVSVFNSDIDISNSVLEYSQSKGIHLEGSTQNTVIENNIFRHNNREESLGYAYGIYSESGSPIIRNNLFEDNLYGLYIGGQQALIEGNTFVNNSKITIAGNINNTFVNNSGNNNGKNGIQLSGELSENRSLQFNQLPYIFEDAVSVNASSTLTIDAGVIAKFNEKILNIYGRMEVKGTEGNRVIFTSIADDSDGNDYLNDGQVDEIGVNHFAEIILNEGSTSQIENAEFRYFNKALVYRNSPINLNNIWFKNNIVAIQVDGLAIVETIDQNNIFFENNIATSTVPLW